MHEELKALHDLLSELAREATDLPGWQGRAIAYALHAASDLLHLASILAAGNIHRTQIGYLREKQLKAVELAQFAGDELNEGKKELSA